MALDGRSLRGPYTSTPVFASFACAVNVAACSASTGPAIIAVWRLSSSHGKPSSYTTRKNDLGRGLVVRNKNFDCQVETPVIMPAPFLLPEAVTPAPAEDEVTAASERAQQKAMSDEL
eukprot:14492163-Heterocapsa_arctica.AAC.1